MVDFRRMREESRMISRSQHAAIDIIIRKTVAWGIGGWGLGVFLNYLGHIEFEKPVGHQTHGQI